MGGRPDLLSAKWLIVPFHCGMAGAAVDVDEVDVVVVIVVAVADAVVVYLSLGRQANVSSGGGDFGKKKMQQ